MDCVFFGIYYSHQGVLKKNEYSVCYLETLKSLSAEREVDLFLNIISTQNVTAIQI